MPCCENRGVGRQCEWCNLRRSGITPFFAPSRICFRFRCLSCAICQQAKRSQVRLSTAFLPACRIERTAFCGRVSAQSASSIYHIWGWGHADRCARGAWTVLCGPNSKFKREKSYCDPTVLLGAGLNRACTGSWQPSWCNHEAW